MTIRDHEKLLASLFFGYGLLQTFGWVVAGGWNTGEWLLLLSAGLFLLTGWKIHNQRSGAKMFGIIASILCLSSIPFGTALGVYGLWLFLLGSKKHF